jgi:hypothetical protein
MQCLCATLIVQHRVAQQPLKRGDKGPDAADAPAARTAAAAAPLSHAPPPPFSS